MIPRNFKTAIVIEPNPMDLDILTRQMTLLGLEFTILPNAAAPRRPLTPDIIFVSHTANSVADVETMQAQFPGVPVVAMLVTADPLQVPDGVATLRKPFRREDLFNCIQAAPKPAARPLQILAAEDNKTNQLVFRKMLKGLSVDLTLVQNGVEAVDAFKAGEFDLVFMDISMPEMDGMEASRIIRQCEQDRGTPPVPIIAMTAHAMGGDEERIKEAGLSHYLTKPLKKDKIHDLIRELTSDATATN